MQMHREISMNHWPLSTGSSANTYSTQAALSVDLIEKYNPVVMGSLPCVLWNGTLYAVDKTESNRLYAVNLATNTVKWRFTADFQPSVILSLLAFDGYVYVGTGSRLYALEDTENAYLIKWAQEGASSLNYAGSSLFYSAREPDKPPVIVSIDAKTGVQKFRVTIGVRNDEIGNLTLGGGRIFFVLRNHKTDQYSRLYCISAATGRFLWFTHLGVYGIPSTYTPAYSGERLYLDLEPEYQGRTRCQIVALDAATGKTLWKYNVENRFTRNSASNRFVVTQDSVIIPCSDGFLISINKDTGVERWKVKYAEVDTRFGIHTGSRVQGTLIAAEDSVILDNHGKIKMYAIATGTLLKDFRLPGGNYRPVAVVQEGLLLTDLQKLVLYAPPRSADTARPTVALDSFNLPRFSPYHEGYNVTGASINLSADAYIQAEIRNENNQVIKHIDYGLLKSGCSYLLWNGTDDRRKPAPYGKYYFVLQLKDLQDNTAQYEFPGVLVTIGDITGKALKNTELRIKPGTRYSAIGFVPADGIVVITDETDDWFKVTYQGSLTGYVPKDQVATLSKPGDVIEPLLGFRR